METLKMTDEELRVFLIKVARKESLTPSQENALRYVIGRDMPEVKLPVLPLWKEEWLIVADQWIAISLKEPTLGYNATAALVHHCLTLLGWDEVPPVEDIPDIVRWAQGVKRAREIWPSASLEMNTSSINPEAIQILEELEDLVHGVPHKRAEYLRRVSVFLEYAATHDLPLGTPNAVSRQLPGVHPVFLSSRFSLVGAFDRPDQTRVAHQRLQALSPKRTRTREAVEGMLRRWYPGLSTSSIRLISQHYPYAKAFADKWSTLLSLYGKEVSKSESHKETKIGEDNTLSCPGCQGRELHQYKVAVWEREEDAVPVHVIVDRAGVHIDQDASSNPSERRSGASIWFWCEGCPGRFRFDVRQHKGSTYTAWYEVSENA